MQENPGLTTRERIIQVTAELLATQGSDAVSTRAVAAAAHVQAPTLYRLFGDKQGLIEAVTSYGFEQYLTEKKSLIPSDDAIADLRRGWNNHVEFGLTHPAFYTLMFGPTQPHNRPTAVNDAFILLRKLLDRVALAGQLILPVEQAAHLVFTSSIGVTLTLISTPAADRDLELSKRTRDIILGAITHGGPSQTNTSLAARALALDAALPRQPKSLTANEIALLRDWLQRLANPVVPEHADYNEDAVSSADYGNQRV